MRETIATYSDYTAFNAAVGIDSITIIAGFITLGVLRQIQAANPITAARNAAVIGAAIRLHLVPVVAGFDTVLDLTIATTCQLAAGQTGVGIEFITIIADLKPIVILLQISAQEAVTTTCESTGIRARIKV